MAYDLKEHRASSSEQDRIASLFRLIPKKGIRALDIGARDGYLSQLLINRFQEVVALDLCKPDINVQGIIPLEGDITNLQFPNRSFDLVLCAEVLEHIPPEQLQTACDELSRVASGTVVIGVPFKQDIRLGRTTCECCGASNPPWGHVNRFDEQRLRKLFNSLKWHQVEMVGSTNAHTNRLSTSLLDYAGNPFGTYMQEEACIYCGNSIGSPKSRTLSQRLATKLAYSLNHLQSNLQQSHPSWIHVALTVRQISK